MSSNISCKNELYEKFGIYEYIFLNVTKGKETKPSENDWEKTLRLLQPWLYAGASRQCQQQVGSLLIPTSLPSEGVISQAELEHHWPSLALTR